jgi:hypothetical protein
MYEYETKTRGGRKKRGGVKNEHDGDGSNT